MRMLITAAGDRYGLGKRRTYLIGRAAECNIVAHDLACSREHARLTVDDDGKTVFVEDLDSSNGTFVNDRRIDEKTRLNVGSRLRIGGTVYLLSPSSLPKHRKVSLVDTGTVVHGNILDVGSDDEPSH